MRFLFGDCELELVVSDVYSARTDVIVSPATRELEPNARLAGEIARQSGERLQHERKQLLREYGVLESGMALYTGAGQLPYRAIIHAILPSAGESDWSRLLKLAISRSLQMCELNDWHSIAFPGFCDEADGTLPAVGCAHALFQAITRFWDARQDSALKYVAICLAPAHYALFSSELGGFDRDTAHTGSGGTPDSEERIGYVDLSDETDAADDDEIDNWFR